jgi:hypothetical protein
MGDHSHCDSGRAEIALNIVFESIANIAILNDDLEVSKYAPGFCAFATDGGNEVYAFVKMGADYMLSMVGLSAKDAVEITESWIEYE